MIVKYMLNYQTPLDLAFQALADPTRRAIVERLAARPASVSELKRPLAMSLPAVMQHLAVLETSGLVVSQKSIETKRGRDENMGPYSREWYRVDRYMDKMCKRSIPVYYYC